MNETKQKKLRTNQLGEWDNLVIGFVPNEMEQRHNALMTLQALEIRGISAPYAVDIAKNLKQRDPSGNLSNRYM